MRSRSSTTAGMALLTSAALVLLAPPAYAASAFGGTSTTGTTANTTSGSASTSPNATVSGSQTGPAVATQTIDGVTFPASFPAASLNTLKVSTPASLGVDADRAVRPIPRNTTNITTDLYVPGKIRGVNGEPPLAHCRNLVGGGRQCVTPAPEGGW